MYIFDIDGTLSVVGDRIKYLQQDKKDWDSFYDACDEDEPNINTINLCRQLGKHETIILCTGRRESTRQKTIDWLNKYLLINTLGNLYMRKTDDYRHDTIIKPEMIAHIPKESIDIIFEDRNSMVKKWRKLGYTCLQVAEGNF